MCVCGQKSLLVDLDHILLVKSPSDQLLSYSITFQLGDFYVSTLAFRLTLFREAPVLPACFLIHERKHQACHDELFNNCCKLAPSLCKSTVALVTEEQAYVNTINYQKTPPICLSLEMLEPHFQGCDEMAVWWTLSHFYPFRNRMCNPEDIVSFYYKWICGAGSSNNQTYTKEGNTWNN